MIKTNQPGGSKYVVRGGSKKLVIDTECNCNYKGASTSDRGPLIPGNTEIWGTPLKLLKYSIRIQYRMILVSSLPFAAKSTTATSIIRARASRINNDLSIH